jgi:hypothetical protein
MCFMNCLSLAFVIKVKNIPLVREITANLTVVGTASVV